LRCRASFIGSVEGLPRLTMCATKPLLLRGRPISEERTGVFVFLGNRPIFVIA
jgi:hypothetical protein